MCEGDEMTLPTPTHGSVPDYATTCRKSYMHTPIRQNRRIRLQEPMRRPRRDTCSGRYNDSAPSGVSLSIL
jgi:hypothetical protein